MSAPPPYYTLPTQTHTHTVHSSLTLSSHSPAAHASAAAAAGSAASQLFAAGCNFLIAAAADEKGRSLSISLFVFVFAYFVAICFCCACVWVCVAVCRHSHNNAICQLPSCLCCPPPSSHTHTSTQGAQFDDVTRQKDCDVATSASLSVGYTHSYIYTRSATVCCHLQAWRRRLSSSSFTSPPASTTLSFLLFDSSRRSLRFFSRSLSPLPTLRAHLWFLFLSFFSHCLPVFHKTAEKSTCHRHCQRRDVGSAVSYATLRDATSMSAPVRFYGVFFSTRFAATATPTLTAAAAAAPFLWLCRASSLFMAANSLRSLCFALLAVFHALFYLIWFLCLRISFWFAFFVVPSCCWCCCCRTGRQETKQGNTPNDDNNDVVFFFLFTASASFCFLRTVFVWHVLQLAEIRNAISTPIPIFLSLSACLPSPSPCLCSNCEIIDSLATFFGRTPSWRKVG